MLKASRPLLLICGHSFCTKCVDELIRTRQRKCPMCRQKIYTQGSESVHMRVGERMRVDVMIVIRRGSGVTCERRSTLSGSDLLISGRPKLSTDDTEHAG